MSKSFSERRTNNIAEPRRAVIWSPDARVDLSEIWDYYVGVAGRHTADGVVRGIIEVCSLLEEHPFSGRARNEVGQACDQLQLVLMSSSIA